MKRKPTEKLSQEEFTLRAIRRLRSGKYLGIHTVYSGFNAIFRAYFDQDPVAATRALEKQGKITIMPTSGGAIIYDRKDKPKGEVVDVEDALKKVLGE